MTAIVMGYLYVHILNVIHITSYIQHMSVIFTIIAVLTPNQASQSSTHLRCAALIRAVVAAEQAAKKV